MKLNGREVNPGPQEYHAAIKAVEEQWAKRRELEMNSNLNDVVSQLAFFMTRMDSFSEKIDDESFSKIYKALSQGAIIGYHLSLTVYRPALVATHDIIRAIKQPSYPTINDEVIEHNLSGDYFMNVGLQGVEELDDETREWIEMHEDRLVQDIATQRFVRIGCGTVMAAVKAAFQNQLVEDAVVAIGPIDWDTIDWSGSSKND